MEKPSIEESNPPSHQIESGDKIAKATSRIREEVNKIFIEGTPSETKAGFFEALDKRIFYLDREAYEDRFGHNGLAHFDGVVFQTDMGKMVENPAIYVNKDAFISEGEDYSDLIPIIVRHEVAEFWTYAKTGYSFSPAPRSIGKERRVAFAHGLALRNEYEYAFKLGKADRYLEFVKKHVGDNQNVIKENEEAYQLAKRRYERKSQNG